MVLDYIEKGYIDKIRKKVDDKVIQDVEALEKECTDFKANFTKEEIKGLRPVKT